MPIGPFHLDPDRRRPKKDEPQPFLHTVHYVGIAVVLIAGLAAALVWGRPVPSAIYFKCAGAVLVLVFIWRLKVGWDEDGIAGLWYFWHQPWGSSLLGDDPGPKNQDPFTATVWWVGLALAGMCVALWLRLLL